MHGNGLNDTWLSFFGSKNLTILNTDFTYQDNIDLQEDNPKEEHDMNYNAFEILSAAKNEKSDHTLGQRYIDVVHDWKSHDIKVSMLQLFMSNFF